MRCCWHKIWHKISHDDNKIMWNGVNEGTAEAEREYRSMKASVAIQLAHYTITVFLPSKRYSSPPVFTPLSSTLTMYVVHDAHSSTTAHFQPRCLWQATLKRGRERTNILVYTSVRRASRRDEAGRRRVWLTRDPRSAHRFSRIQLLDAAPEEFKSVKEMALNENQIGSTYTRRRRLLDDHGTGPLPISARRSPLIRQSEFVGIYTRT